MPFIENTLENTQMKTIKMVKLERTVVFLARKIQYHYQRFFFVQRKKIEHEEVKGSKPGQNI